MGFVQKTQMGFGEMAPSGGMAVAEPYSIVIEILSVAFSQQRRILNHSSPL